jgi:hypothetical protein
MHQVHLDIREEKREPCFSLNLTEGPHSPHSLTLGPHLSETSLLLSLRPMHTQSMQIEEEVQSPSFPLDLLLLPDLPSTVGWKWRLEKPSAKIPSWYINEKFMRRRRWGGDLFVEYRSVKHSHGRCTQLGQNPIEAVWGSIIPLDDSGSTSGPWRHWLDP